MASVPVESSVNNTVSQGSTARRQLSDRAIMNLFIWPSLLLLIVFNFFPLFYSLYLSFTNYRATGNAAPLWLGIQNYANILTDPGLWEAFTTSGRYVLFSVALQTLVGFALAMLVRGKFRGSGLVTTLILVPMMLSPVVVGLFWKLMYNPNFGYFNYLIGLGGASQLDMLASRIGNQAVPGVALAAVILVDVWMWSPFVMLLVLSGLNAIPDYLYEAAAIDRASSWFQFWRITLPQVMPLLLIAVLFRTIEALKSFDLVMGLTGGGPGNQTELIAVYLYRVAFLGQFRSGYSSALAYIVLLIVIAVSNLYIRNLNKAKGEG